MSSSLGSLDFLDLLPGSISGDATMQAAAMSLNGVLRSTSLAIPNLLLQARLWNQPAVSMLPPLARLTDARGGLKPLSMAELELLAWQMHVDFREVAITKEQLAEMVRQSIPWHRIKGTPASVRKALALFGYSATIEANGPGRWWATYQLGLPELVSLDDVRQIVSICKEMAPARSHLWRVYAGYDWRPGVWSGGLPDNAWSNFWWTMHSGLPVPGIPGIDGDHDLIVSFGLTHRTASNPYTANPHCAAVARNDRFAFVAPYLDRFYWGRSRWSDPYHTATAFVAGQVQSVGWAAEHRYWDMGQCLAWSRAQLTYADKPDDAGSGAWGDINACYGVPVLVADAPSLRWSAYRWSQQEPRRVVRVDERSAVTARSVMLPALLPTAFATATASHRAILAPYIDRPIWGQSCWSDTHPPSQGFAIDQAQRLHWCEPIWRGGPWTGHWDDRPWGRLIDWDRPLPPWGVVCTGLDRAQHVYGDAPDNAGSGAWGDINASYGPCAAMLSGAPPQWSGFSWGDSGQTAMRQRVTVRRADVMLTATPGRAADPCGIGITSTTE